MGLEVGFYGSCPVDPDPSDAALIRVLFYVRFAFQNGILNIDKPKNYSLQ